MHYWSANHTIRTTCDICHKRQVCYTCRVLNQVLNLVIKQGAPAYIFETFYVVVPEINYQHVCADCRADGEWRAYPTDTDTLCDIMTSAIVAGMDHMLIGHTALTMAIQTGEACFVDFALIVCPEIQTALFVTAATNWPVMAYQYDNDDLVFRFLNLGAKCDATFLVKIFAINMPALDVLQQILAYANFGDFSPQDLETITQVIVSYRITDDAKLGVLQTMMQHGFRPRIQSLSRISFGFEVWQFFAEMGYQILTAENAARVHRHAIQFKDGRMLELLHQQSLVSADTALANLTHEVSLLDTTMLQRVMQWIPPDSNRKHLFWLAVYFGNINVVEYLLPEAEWEVIWMAILQCIQFRRLRGNIAEMLAIHADINLSAYPEFMFCYFSVHHIFSEDVHFLEKYQPNINARLSFQDLVRKRESMDLISKPSLFYMLVSKDMPCENLAECDDYLDLLDIVAINRYPECVVHEIFARGYELDMGHFLAVMRCFGIAGKYLDLVHTITK